MSRAVDLLLRAQELVAAGWAQGADARAADGRAVEPWAEDAASWSVLGALVAALEEQGARGGELPLGELAVALDALAAYVDEDSLSSWNDRPGHTARDVEAALGRAAADAGRRQPPAISPN